MTPGEGTCRDTGGWWSWCPSPASSCLLAFLVLGRHDTFPGLAVLGLLFALPSKLCPPFCRCTRCAQSLVQRRGLSGAAVCGQSTLQRSTRGAPPLQHSPASKRGWNRPAGWAEGGLAPGVQEGRGTALARCGAPGPTERLAGLAGDQPGLPVPARPAHPRTAPTVSLEGPEGAGHRGEAWLSIPGTALCGVLGLRPRSRP